jgi:hypothetical protein
MGQSDGSNPGDAEPIGRSSPSVRVAERDLAILTAFCRPYLDGARRFASPSPNNEILRELAENGVYIDLDTLRGHLRNLYAKFGVEDGLNPAQKRARLAELVHENSVIPGWEPREDTMPSTARAVSGPTATMPPTFHPSAPVLPGPPEPPRTRRLRGFLHDRWWVAAGVAVLLLGAVVALADRGTFERTPGDGGATAPQVLDNDKRTAAINSTCQPGRFCLGRLAWMSGGLYQHKVSDRDLGDDTFYYYTDSDRNKQLGRVTNHTWSVWNRGRLDVIVYDRPAFTGAGACIPAGQKINFPDRWQDRISSFEFVARPGCNRHVVLSEVNG